MTSSNFFSKSFGPTIAKILLLIGAVLVVMTPRAAPAGTYFDIIPENVDYLNNPLEDMRFEPRCNLMLSGEINANTVAAFKEAVRDLDARSHVSPAKSNISDLEKEPGFRALCMSSSGGKLHDALGLIPHLARWIVVVPEGAVCESACAIAFMGAGRDAGPYGDLGVSSTNRRQARYLHYTGILSFHAPTLDGLADGPYTKEQVLREYERSRLTMGRILYLRGWDILVRQQGHGADTPDLATPAAIEQMLSTVDVDPFLPASLFFTFLITPNKSSFSIQTIEQALLWGIQIYGLSKKDLARGIPEFWMWRTCENLAWMMCHNPSQLSGGCNTVGVTRKTFADASTLPYIIENRERLGIERFSFHLSSSPLATIERVALGNDDQHSHHAYGGGPEKAECGISLYRDKGFIGMRAEYHQLMHHGGSGSFICLLLTTTRGAGRVPPEFHRSRIEQKSSGHGCGCLWIRAYAISSKTGLLSMTSRQGRRDSSKVIATTS